MNEKFVTQTINRFYLCALNFCDEMLLAACINGVRKFVLCTLVRSLRFDGLLWSLVLELQYHKGPQITERPIGQCMLNSIDRW